MLKIQGFFVYKFSSTRLKDYNYNIKINPKQGRLNNEVIRVSESNLIDEIFRLRKINFVREEIKTIELKIKKIRKQKSTEASKLKLEKLEFALDNILFIDEIISVKFDNIAHYKKIIKDGLKINGETYVRLYSGSGNARVQTVFFCKEKMFEKLDYFLDCGRDVSKQSNPNKYNAYYALGTSSGLKITTPRFAVISDYEKKRPTFVDFVYENPVPKTDPIVEENKLMDTDFNYFDGEGLVSPSFMNQIAFDLELDYQPSTAIIRSAFIKGMIVCFDFHEFARTKKLNVVRDIYGKEHNIFELDVILTESQFKGSKWYESLEQYNSEREKRSFGWRVTRVNAKVDKDVSNSNYQYNQVLELSDDEIVSLCKPTVDYFNAISGMDWNSSILFLIGKIKKEDVTKEWFSKLDSTIKILLYEPSMINDKYIQNKIRKMISKKIRESYMGVIKLDSNYSSMISDPYALAENSLGLVPKGLLGNRDFYSNYWNQKKVSKVAGMRSPLTWKSEVNVMDLKQSEEMNYWYKFVKSGVIFNVYDDSVLLHSSADFDGDILMTTSSPEFINRSTKGVAVVYERKVAPKQLINKDELWKSDCRTFVSKIGFLTNLGTSFYSLIANFEKDTKEYEILSNRLKIVCMAQNQQIDYGKGLEIMPIPTWWTKWEKVSDENSDSENEKIKMYNSLLAEKRPYFMRWLYSDYNRDYKKYEKMYDDYCINQFGFTLKEFLSKKERSLEEEKIFYYYHRYNHLSDTPSVMNRLSHHIENSISELKLLVNNTKWNYSVDAEKQKKMNSLYSNWKKLRRKTDKNDYDSLSSHMKKEAELISSNSKDLAKLSLNSSSGFAFSVFGEFLEDLFYKKEVTVPTLDTSGNFIFDGNSYSLTKLNLEDYE